MVILILHVIHRLLVIDADADELIPEEGKDETYDEIVSEIRGLENNLEAELQKFEKNLGYVHCWCLGDMSF